MAKIPRNVQMPPINPSQSYAHHKAMARAAGAQPMTQAKHALVNGGFAGNLNIPNTGRKK